MTILSGFLGRSRSKINLVGLLADVEQLTWHRELLKRDPLLALVHGIFAAQGIRPQARTLATDRGIRCVTLDYDTMRGAIKENTLF